MDATEARLRETYSGRRTEVLVDLLEQGGLSRTACALWDGVRGRGRAAATPAWGYSFRFSDR